MCKFFCLSSAGAQILINAKNSNKLRVYVTEEDKWTWVSKRIVFIQLAKAKQLGLEQQLKFGIIGKKNNININI